MLYKNFDLVEKLRFVSYRAEAGGFEPPIPIAWDTGFQDQLIQPL